MAEAAGWIVAALVAVIAVLARYALKAHKNASTAFDGMRGSAHREGVETAAQADLDALQGKLKGQDPTTSIAEASDLARRGR